MDSKKFVISALAVAFALLVAIPICSTSSDAEVELTDLIDGFDFHLYRDRNLTEEIGVTDLDEDHGKYYAVLGVPYTPELKDDLDLTMDCTYDGKRYKLDLLGLYIDSGCSQKFDDSSDSVPENVYLKACLSYGDSSESQTIEYALWAVCGIGIIAMVAGLFFNPWISLLGGFTAVITSPGIIETIMGMI